MAINSAFNAGLYAAEIINAFDSKIRSNLIKWKKIQKNSIKKKPR